MPRQFFYQVTGAGPGPSTDSLGLVYPTSGVIVDLPFSALSGASSTWQYTSSELGLKNVSFSEEGNGAAYNGPGSPTRFGTYAANGLVGFDGLPMACNRDNHLSLVADGNFGQILRLTKFAEWNLCFSSDLTGSDYRAYIPYVNFDFQSSSSPTVRDVWVRSVRRFGGTSGSFVHNGTRGSGQTDQKTFVFYSGTGLGGNDRQVNTVPGAGPAAGYHQSGLLYTGGVLTYGAGTYGGGGNTTWTKQSDTTQGDFDNIVNNGPWGGGYDTSGSTWNHNAFHNGEWHEHIYRFARDATGDSVVSARYRRKLTGTRILNGVTVTGPGAHGYVDATTAAAGYIWAKQTALKTGVSALPYRFGLNQNSNRCVPADAAWMEFAMVTIVDGITNPNPFQLDANIL